MIKAVFFDFDDTLWNHSVAQDQAIIQVYDEISKINHLLISKEEFVEVYRECNNQVWIQYRGGTLKKDQVKTMRFYNTLKIAGIDNMDLAKEINDFYLEIYPTSTTLIEGVPEILEILHRRYQLGIITNGFVEVQKKKMKGTGIEEYFQWIIFSEAVGKTKPHPEIFQYALKEAKLNKDELIFVGDDFAADIVGAYEMGIKNIWFNPHNMQRDESRKVADFTVTSLKEILPIIENKM